MNPNELMLGDYLQDMWGNSLMIREIHSALKYVAYTVEVMDGVSEGEIRTLDSNSVNPMPLTEEIIQKNFQPRYKDIYELTTLWGIRPFHDHWQVCLLTMDEFGGGSWEGAFEVHYVHEVQQFLRLLKVGKEVEV